MSIALDFPTETAQLRVIARENHLDDDLRVFVPEEDDIMFESDAMVVFSRAHDSDGSRTMNFIQRAGEIFKRKVFLEFDHASLDNLQTLKAAQAAERI